MKIEITQEEYDIILNALLDRGSNLLRLQEMYKKNKDVESQKDCLSEFRKAVCLRDKLIAQ